MHGINRVVVYDFKFDIFGTCRPGSGLNWFQNINRIAKIDYENAGALDNTAGGAQNKQQLVIIIILKMASLSSIFQMK